MGTYYGAGGKNAEANPESSPRGGRDVEKPCPNGILLTNANQPFNGTKMTDALGRVWGCPSTVESTVPDSKITPVNSPTTPGPGPDASYSTPYAPGYGPNTGGGAADVSGVWSMSPELSQLYGGLLGRADDILGMPLGYSPQALASMFGPQFETIRGQERATGNQIQGGLSNLGMTNTGAGMEMMNQNAWNAQNNISNLMRDLFVKNEDVRRSDLLNNTQLAQSLFGSGLGAEQLTEAINAGRRGEASDFWNKLLALLQIYRG